MMDEFRGRKVRKIYLAFVRGIPQKNQGEIKNRIEGLSAETRYKIIEKRKDFAILEVNPLTGRTNQIRIHLKQIGHPILGESKFAFRRDFAIKAKRLMLQAKELSFSHPVTGAQVQVRLELAADMAGFLAKHPH